MDLRNKLIRDNYTGERDLFIQVIFNGPADIDIDIRVPTCELIPIDTDRLICILGNDPDMINDNLHDFDYLCQLPDTRIEELKELFQTDLLSECMKYTLFLNTRKCCKTNQLSKTTKRLTFQNIPLPTGDPTIFCWLQILPLVKSYPCSYIPALTQEYDIAQVLVSVSNFTLITEQAGDKSFYIDMVRRKDDDPISYLFENKTNYDIHCILTQCETFLATLKTPHSQSYRIRLIQFIVYHSKARLAYLAKKLTQISYKNHAYLWYI